jgi:hypothetical protein
MSETTPSPTPVIPAPQDLSGLRERAFKSPQSAMEDLTKVLANVATNAWKLRGRIMVDPKGEEIRDELKRDDIKKLARHVDSIFESLSAFGIEVRDRTGEVYDYGLPDKIVSSTPRPGLSKELIVETLRPTIYFRSHPIQTAEVVIAVPVEKKPEEK